MMKIQRQFDRQKDRSPIYPAKKYSRSSNIANFQLSMQCVSPSACGRLSKIIIQSAFPFKAKLSYIINATASTRFMKSSC